jgi:serine/threonine protein kinase
MKVVSGRGFREEQLLNEVKHLLALHHEGIVRAHGLYNVAVRGTLALAAVLDYKSGIDLSRHLPFPEEAARSISTQLCAALTYLSGRLIVHRDLKPSNVLCESERDGTLTVVIADFGCAARTDNAEAFARPCGTPGFCAPETLRENWRQWVLVVPADDTAADQRKADLLKTDMFSFGVLLYVLVIGTNPFHAGTIQATHDLNALGLPEGALEAFSEELGALIGGLCAMDVQRRCSIAEASAHPWMRADAVAPRDAGASTQDGPEA